MNHSMALDQLTGPMRAALFILGAPEDLAAQVLRSLDEADMRRLASQLDALESVPTETLEGIYAEFERVMKDPLPPGKQAGAYVRRLAENALGPDRARRVFSPPPVETGPIDAIRGAKANTLAELLQEEPPQVAAVIISQLQRDHAARVLAVMPPDLQADLALRIALLKEVPAHAIQVASESLARALGGGPATSDLNKEFDGIAFAASVLNELPPGDSGRLIEMLGLKDEVIAPKIRDAMFTFEDLTRVDNRQLQSLVREIAPELLLVALKTASEAMRDKVFASVSSRQAEALREDLSTLPPKRLSEVEAAQREVVEIARRLAAAGRLVLPGGAEKMV